MRSFVLFCCVLVCSMCTYGQTYIYVDVPSGDTYSNVDPAPAASVVTNDWEEDAGYGELTSGSVYPPVADADVTQAEGEVFEISITIPEDGEWFMWLHYNYPFAQVSSFKPSFYVLDGDGNYVSSSDGPAADPAPLLDDNVGPFGLWAWDGSPGDDSSINENSMGASLGELTAGEYSILFHRGETSEGTGGADADPLQNPHFEMIYLTNGGADDVPSDEEFLATQPLSGSRTLNPPTYPGFGGPINVSVIVQPQQQSGMAVTVTENAPAGLIVDNLDASAGSAEVDADNVITWEIPALSETVTLNYTVFVDSGSTDVYEFSGTMDAEGTLRPISGQVRLELLTFFIFETFAYPTLEPNANEGAGVATLEQPLGGGNEPLQNGWASFWTDPDDIDDALNTRIIDSGLVASQPQEFNPGNFCLEISGDGGSGVRRQIDPVNTGELWLSFTFLDEGPAAGHWAGITLYDSEGGESSFVGKPYDAESAGIGNLPDGDSLAEGESYQDPHHYLVRYVLNSGQGQNDSVYLWIDPNESDTLGSYDAGGADVDEILDIAEVRLRRGDASGSAFFDNIIIGSVPALPPEGSGRVELLLDNPDELGDLPGWDVVCIDQIDDTIYNGNWGYGHDPGDSYYLLVSGYIYWENADQTGNQLIGYGLPPDHISGLNGHLLGDYNNQFENLGMKNSMKFEDQDGQRGPFTFDVVPAGNYAELRAVMTVGGGDGELFATFHYEDGSTEEGVFHADDWYDDPPQTDYKDEVQLINGMNRIDGNNNFDGRYDPAFFENAEEVNPDKVLTQVTLEKNLDVGGAVNLFDILALPEQEPTSIDEWSLY